MAELDKQAEFEARRGCVRLRASLVLAWCYICVAPRRPCLRPAKGLPARRCGGCRSRVRFWLRGSCLCANRQCPPPSLGHHQQKKSPDLSGAPTAALSCCLHVVDVVLRAHTCCLQQSRASGQTATRWIYGRSYPSLRRSQAFCGQSFGSQACNSSRIWSAALGHFLAVTTTRRQTVLQMSHRPVKQARGHHCHCRCRTSHQPHDRKVQVLSLWRAARRAARAAARAQSARLATATKAFVRAPVIARATVRLRVEARPRGRERR